jgi:hypothetical protein
MNKTIKIIQFVHYNPMSSLLEILQSVKISDTSFYRYKIRASKYFGVEISFSVHGLKRGYKITDYGIIDRSKL